MKYTQIPTTTFSTMQLNAGVLLDTFNPSSPSVTSSNIIGATSGGVNFNATPTYTDVGEDIDNCPKNMMELKRLDGWEVFISGTMLTVNAARVAQLIGAADVSGNKITPRRDVSEDDFDDIWWVGDYSDKNGATNGGFVAIHMMNTLSTGGFQLQSADKGKGQFSFEFTAHTSIDEQDVVPFEVYVQSGTDEPASPPPSGT